jgi:EAL domain-containing protein (putative c-di-GMP-specific phosphodiesterase class I)
LDKLKIDKVFIDDLLKISKKQNLVKSIIAMAKSLNLTVVAEGIETNEQLLCLKEYGCHLGQGYLLSKPLPAEKTVLILDRLFINTEFGR